MNRFLILVALVAIPACNCGTDKLRETPDQCTEHPASCELPYVPVAPRNDAGSVDSGTPDSGFPPCTNTGAVSGKVCAPDQRTWVNGADVTVTAIDCNGQNVSVTTTTAADGSFSLTDVPAGAWTVHAVSGAFNQDTPVTVTVGQTTTIPDNELCIAQKDAKIAVITAAGDHIETLLTSLNLTYDTYVGDSTGYTGTTGAEPFLANLSKMQQYDLIFINCATAKAQGGNIDFGSRAALIEQNLHDYVANGGSLYASDWGLIFTLYAQQGGMSFSTSTGAQPVSPLNPNILMGYAPQTVSASIVDSGLAAFMSKQQLSVIFPNQSGARDTHWGLIENVASNAHVLVQAPSVQVCDTSSGCSGSGGSATNVPLAVQIKVTPPNSHGGNIIYTSFHNIAQSGTDVAQVLKYIILHL